MNSNERDQFNPIGLVHQVEIHCLYDLLAAPDDLKPHPKNRNKHPKAQIKRLAALFNYHGIRHPVVVSKRSGYVVAGHGRIEAARLARTPVPVVYQDFPTDEAEYAFIQSDNAIGLWADLDLAGINADLPDLGPDFDLDMLGLKGFTLDPEPSDDTDEAKDKFTFMECPHCGERFEKKQAKVVND